MSLDADDEILQDFLVEASEILEQLNEQLVELEQSPSDADLLNAVFRGFHTIKGGAGFLSLTPLVEVCHRSEDIFNLLRNGEKELTPAMMDSFLEVLDILNEQFDSLRAMEEPTSASPELLATLEAMNHPGNDEPAETAAAPEAAPAAEPAPAAEAAPAEAAAPAETAAQEEGDITDEEFEALLDALDSEAGAKAAEPAPAAAEPVAGGGDEDITEEEFEALLDQLHGKGKFGAVAGAAEAEAPKAEEPKAAAPAAASGGDEDITEEEFEALLDQLHGKGKFGAVAGQGEAPEAPAAEPPKPAEPAKPAAPAKPAEPTKPAAAAKPAAAPKKKSEAPQAETTVRVDTARLDDIMNMVGELVLVRNRLSTLAGEELDQAKEEMTKAVGNLDVVTGDLQMAVMKTRMQPIKKVFGRFPRVVRDLARSLKKDVRLDMIGEDTDLDKNLVEALADPLVHLVRNSVDHGVEMPDVRESLGKPRQGMVRLAAQQEGDHILLTIEDDGAGMDPEKLKKIAIKKGVLDEDSASRMDDREAFMLIFAPGFSTKEEISDISGRGVGMDVVKTRISQLNGSVEIDSEQGKGTLLSIKVPLTLAIMPTLMVKLGQQTFALPLVNVNEIFHLDLTDTNVVDGKRVVMIREKPLPLFYLSGWLVDGVSTELPSAGHVVVVHVGTQQVGFVVDQLIGQEEVVIKPLGALLHGTQGMAGATITGDGKIALILDVPSLMKAYA